MKEQIEQIGMTDDEWRVIVQFFSKAGNDKVSGQTAMDILELLESGALVRWRKLTSLVTISPN